MQDLTAVEDGEGVGEVPRDPRGLLGVHGGLLAELAEGLAGHEVAHQVGLTRGGLGELDHPDHVGVLDLGQELGLALEADQEIL